MRIERIPAAAYFADKALSRSFLWTLIEKSPRKAWFELEEGKDPTPAMTLGTAIHTAILEPYRWDTDYTVGTQKRTTKEGKAAYEEAIAAGRTYLTPEQAATAMGCSAAVAAHEKASKILSGGEPEVSVFWQDEETGLDLKARFDYLRSDGIIVDIKSTSDANPKDFQRSAWHYGYHFQAAFYLRAAKAVGIPATAFVLIAVETSPPFDVAVYVADQDFILHGEAAVQSALGKAKDCIATQTFPGYGNEIFTLSAPVWAALR